MAMEIKKMKQEAKMIKSQTVTHIPKPVVKSAKMKSTKTMRSSVTKSTYDFTKALKSVKSTVGKQMNGKTPIIPPRRRNSLTNSMTKKSTKKTINKEHIASDRRTENEFISNDAEHYRPDFDRTDQVASFSESKANFSQSNLNEEVEVIPNPKNKTNIAQINELLSLNKTIESQTKAIPNLIEKVEKTIEKINNQGLLAKHVHPLIKLASKHCGKLVHLHIESLTEMIIDDLMLEGVEFLQENEKKSEEKERQNVLKDHIMSYYDDFEHMRRIETGIKLNLESNYDKTSKVKETENSSSLFECQEKLEDGEQFKYPGRYNKKIRFRAVAPKGLLKTALKNSKAFYENQLITGTYFMDNVFVAYDKVAQWLLDDMLNWELSKYEQKLDEEAERILFDNIIELY